MVSRVLFDAVDLNSNQSFSNFFLIPFQISYRIGKAFIFNKKEGNNKKVEKYQVGLG